MEPSKHPLGPHAVALVDWELLVRAAGRRAIGVALASGLHYVEAPALADGILRAALGRGHTARSGHPFQGAQVAAVALRLSGSHGAISGDCSVCTQAFGPCSHVTTLAIDFARCAPLREALLRGCGVDEAAALAPPMRAAMNAELEFDQKLSAWLSPGTEARPVEIAASPFAERSGHLGRSYGDRSDGGPAAVVSVVVRRAGERKLLSERDITPPVHFGARDRRVLEHMRDRGLGRKAAYAVGVDASLAIDAMRLHGGVYADGYKARLDFRPQALRPTLKLGPAGASLPGRRSTPFRRRG